jgi:hypothetical protein
LYFWHNNYSFIENILGISMNYKNKIVAMMLMLFSLAIFSCSDDDDGGNNNLTNDVGTMTANVAGAPFSEFNSSLMIFVNTSVSLIKSYSITGNHIIGNTTYSISIGITGAVGATVKSTRLFVADGSGTVKYYNIENSILNYTEDDNYVTGTFSFKAVNPDDNTDVMTFSNGNFRADKSKAVSN